MSVTGAPDGPPMKAGPTLVDYMGGIHLYGAILTALYDRMTSGEGRLVEVAMQETVYSSLAASFEYYQPHRPAAAAYRQPPGRVVDRPLQRLPDRRRPHRNPQRHRAALAEPDESDGARENWRRTHALPPTRTASPTWTTPTRS